MLVLLTVVINMYNQEEKVLYCLLHTFCLEACGSSCTKYAKSEVNLLTDYTVFLQRVYFGVLFGDLNTPSFARISRLNWIFYVNRMDSERKVSQVFNNTPGSGLRGQPKSRGWSCVHTDINNFKIKNKKKRGKKTKLTRRNPLRRRRSALVSSAT
jgi:hypothetical protein